MPTGIYKRKPRSEDHKRNLSRALMGNNHSLGTKRTEEQKKKLRDFHIGKKMSQESREKMSLSRKGKKLSEKTKRKISLRLIELKHAPPILREENSHNWKGDNAGYVAIHVWLKKKLGKAFYCSNDLLHKAKRFEWASISRKARRDIDDYKSLCPSCHRKYDYTVRKNKNYEMSTL